MDDRTPPTPPHRPGWVDPAAEETALFVPLEQHLQLARLVYEMRRAQRAYFDARKRAPHVNPRAEWNAARDAERRADSAVADALARERVSLPGMEGGAT